MTTYLLVHGAWSGGWIWSRVAPILRKARHDVFTPTLTGLGERAHLANPDIDLSTHIQDVVAILECEDLQRVVLVGHSYGGMVITGVAERTAERLSHLVYLDAFVPQDGQSLADLVSPDLAASFEEGVRLNGDGWRIPPPPPDWSGVTDEADQRWIQSRLTPQPIKTMFEPVRLSNPEAAELPRTYVYCNNPAMGLFDRFASRARAEGWRYQVLSTCHAANVTAPNQVADLLLELLGRGATMMR
jgi:pimeloyl-ACP methyl ester carboxylesterase